MRPIDKVLAKAKDVKILRNNSWQCQCSAHDDKHASLTITEADDGQVLLHCHAGCSVEAVLAAWGLQMSDLFPAPATKKPASTKIKRAKIANTYDYRDTNGELIYQAVRRDPKGFSQRRPDGKGGWINNLDGIEPVPYKLPQVIKALKDGEMVFIVEGEKDADNLHKLRLAATCNSGGAGKWGEAHSRYFSADDRVVIIPDNDDPGRKHAHSVAQRLIARGCEVRILELPDLPLKGDVSDYLTKNSASDFTALVQAKMVVPALTLGDVEHQEQQIEIQFPGFTDLGNMSRLVMNFGNSLIYVPEHGKFYCQKYGIYKPDEDGHVERLAKQLPGTILSENPAAESDERRARQKWAKQTANIGRIRAAVELLKTEAKITVPATRLDSNPWLMGCQNGVIDLRAGQLTDVDSDVYITKSVNTEFIPDATCPLWEQTLTEIFSGQVDLINYFQRLCGYCLTGMTNERVFVFFVGSGSNGKTIVTGTLQTLLGDYARTTPAQTFLNGRDGGALSDLARLQGCRLAVCTELEAQQQLAVAILKRLVSGGDTITCRFLYKDFFEFIPNFKIIMATNELPAANGDDQAFWRRVQVVPFNEVFEGDRQDKGRAEKLLDELPGILNWALIGCLEWQRIGLTAPDIVKAAAREYRADNDVISGFIAARCRLSPGLICTAKQLRDSLAEYSEEMGETPPSPKALARRLKLLSCTSERLSLGIRWRGIGVYGSLALVENDEDEAAPY